MCMGKVLVTIKLTNWSDVILVNRQVTKRKPRTVEVEALVDTGATRLYLKPSVIRKLGLVRVDAGAFAHQGNNGNEEVGAREDARPPSNGVRFKYEPVQLELMGRKENFDVIEVPESVPNLLGQVPLDVLDLVVDSKGRKLIPNPAHGGEQMTEEY